jgi:hypothetical protein
VCTPRGRSPSAPLIPAVRVLSRASSVGGSINCPPQLGIAEKGAASVATTVPCSSAASVISPMCSARGGNYAEFQRLVNDVAVPLMRSSATLGQAYQCLLEANRLH